MPDSLKSQHGSSMLVMTFFVMASILVISLSLSAIVVNGLKLGTDQVQSTKAFFAAEAGAERILWEMRKNSIDPQDIDGGFFGCENKYFCFNNQPIGVLDGCDLITNCAIGRQRLLNESLYSIKYDYDNVGLVTTLLSYGNYNDINRVIELKF